MNGQRPESSADWVERLKKLERDASRIARECSRLEYPLADGFEALRVDLGSRELLGVLAGAWARVAVMRDATRGLERILEEACERLKQEKAEAQAPARESAEVWLRRQLGRLGDRS